MHEDYPGKPSFLMGLLPLKSWSTQKAAEAAIDHFRTWVDEGRRKRTAAATEVSNVRIPGDEIVLPQRFSQRKSITRVDATAYPCVRDGHVKVALILTTHAGPSTRDEYNEEWMERSAAMHNAAKKRRLQPSNLMASLARLSTNAMQATAQAMASTRIAVRSVTRRGKARGQMVSVHRARADRHRPERRVAREEVRLSKLQESMAEAHGWRVEHIERLKNILLLGDPSDLLGRSEEEGAAPISAAQTQRLMTQGWSLVCLYKELDRLEASVAAGTEEVPRSGVLLAAAAKAGEEYGVSTNTVRGWQLEYVSNEFKFVADGRGHWVRELLIHEEDLQRKFHKWMVRVRTL